MSGELIKCLETKLNHQAELIDRLKAEIIALKKKKRYTQQAYQCLINNKTIKGEIK